jgi:hypothetical protein
MMVNLQKIHCHIRCQIHWQVPGSCGFFWGLWLLYAQEHFSSKF